MTHFTKRYFMTPGITLLVILCCLTIMTAPGSAEKVLPGDTPHGLGTADWNAIMSQIQQHQYRTIATDGGYYARNLSQQWQTRFDETGFMVTPHAGEWTWGLVLTSYGLAGAEQPVHSPSTLNTRDNRVEYTWDPILTEWLINDKRGLEHGFTLHQRPDGVGEMLALTLRVQGGLQPQGHSNGRGITFINDKGAAVVHYAGLMVFDAQGRDLPASLSVEGDALRLVVNDSQAIYPVTIDPVAQQAYLKASNTDAGDRFGYAVAISGDTIVVGAPEEDSMATGVNNNQNDNSFGDSGAAYVFVRSGSTWTQQAYLKASNTGALTEGDGFGYAVAISGDTIVVGAPYEDSNATGINGAQNDNSFSGAGAAYVFVRSGTAWSQQAYLKASNTDAGDGFGSAVAIDGNTVVVGAPYEDSNRTNGQANNSATDAGAAYVFVRNVSSWSQQAYLKANNTGAYDLFGVTVAISGDTIVVGAEEEDSSTTGVNTTPNENALNSGAAYVFFRSGSTWAQQAYLKASNTGTGDKFGCAVSISGETAVVGAYGEKSSATGVNGNQSDDSFSDAGAAYVFVRSGTSWSQQAYLKASNTGQGDYFGFTVGISGNTIVVGAQGEASNATGIDGNQSNNDAADSGAVYVFGRSGTTWSQSAYLKASNTGADDRFGCAVAISDATVVVGAYGEDSNATGVGGNQSDNSKSASGAAYVFLITPDNSYLLWTK